MAGIGLYGVYYAIATMDDDGKVSGYGGVKTMGKAISANFTPANSDDNPLYANNGIAETDGGSVSGGTLTLTLDALKQDAIADLFGLTKKTASVTVGTATVTGSGFDYDGSETAATVGVAFVRQMQENNDRGIHEAVIFSSASFNMPNEEMQTLGESVEWQTPEIEGTVANNVDADHPWFKRYRFPTQAAAVQFITDYFAATT